LGVEFRLTLSIHPEYGRVMSVAVSPDTMATPLV
jgi:hypothetical protein